MPSAFMNTEFIASGKYQSEINSPQMIDSKFKN